MSSSSEKSFKIKEKLKVILSEQSKVPRVCVKEKVFHIICVLYCKIEMIVRYRRQMKKLGQFLKEKNALHSDNDLVFVGQDGFASCGRMRVCTNEVRE